MELAPSALIQRMIGKKNNFFLLSIIVLIYSYAWQLQASLLLNTDVSWLLYAARQLTQGGSYTSNFLETNPPLIIYLLTPAIFFQCLFQIDVIIILRVYIFFIASISLLYCYNLINKIIIKEHVLIRLILMVTLSSMFLIVPASEFGQREHIAVMFITPYIFFLASLLDNKSIAIQHSIIIAVMAAIGFALKPYFYIPLICIEMCYIYYTNKWSSFFHKEMLIIFFTGCLYLGAILLFNNDYIMVILPLIKSMYYAKYQQNISSLLLNDASIYGFFVVVFYFVQYTVNPYKKLSTLILVAMIGFWLVFLWQHIGWFYHSLPFYMYAILLSSILFSVLVLQPALTLAQYLSIGTLVAGLISYYYVKMSYISLSIFYCPSMIFILADSLFAVLFYVMFSKSNKTKIIFFLSVIFIINTVFYHYTMLTMLRKHLFSLTISMLLLTFLMVVPKKKLFYADLAIVGMIFFIYPFFKTAYVLNYSWYYKKLYQHMVADMRQYSKNERIYFFTLASELVFPLIDYAKLNYVSRFWSLFWLPALEQPENIAQYPIFYHQHQQELDFYINAILSDFNKNKPTVIVVDIRKSGYFFNVPPDYINLFSNNNAFKERWSNYHLLKIIDFPPLYKFAIYV